MARTLAGLPAGTRLTDYLSLGVIATTFPLATVHRTLAVTGRASQRERDLPAHVMVYYVIALALYMQSSTREVLRCLLEGVRWLAGPDADIIPACKSGISQARTRLGVEPLQHLFDTIVQPIATPDTPGAWYVGHGPRGTHRPRWRVMSLDGTTLDVADTAANVAEFRRPGSHSSPSAYPQVRLSALAEVGTHVLCAVTLAQCHTSEYVMARKLFAHLTPEMLCLADRCYLSYEYWQAASATGAALLWRAKCVQRLPCVERLADGSYLSYVAWNKRCSNPERVPIPVRVIEYTLPGTHDTAGPRAIARNQERAPAKRRPLDRVATTEHLYRLVTTILDPAVAPAEELAALYHERWEIETTFDEFKTHLRGARIVLRSKTPPLVRQEIYGLLLAHFAIRRLIHDAAVPGSLRRDGHARDPDTVSFTHAIRVVRRLLPHAVAIPPSGPGDTAPPLIPDRTP